MKRKASRQSISSRRKIPRTEEFRAASIHSKDVALARTSGINELKATYRTYNNNVDSSGIIINLLSTLSQGAASIDQYIGSNIKPTSIRLKLAWLYGPNLAVSADATNTARIIVFQWKESATPTVSGILQQTPYVDATKLWTNREEIVILSDRRYGFQAWADPATSCGIHVDEIYIKSKKILPIKFPNAGGNIAQRNGVFALVVTDSTAPVHPSVRFTSTITFTDS